jgi:hypothetical protein
LIYLDYLFEALKRNKEGNQWCHMIADTEQELHEFAEKIGRNKCWFHKDHYDLTPSFRQKAIDNGAIVLGRFEFIRKRNEILGD